MLIWLCSYFESFTSEISALVTCYFPVFLSKKCVQHAEHSTGNNVMETWLRVSISPAGIAHMRPQWVETFVPILIDRNDN